MNARNTEAGNVSLEFIAIVVALLIPLTFIASAVAGVVQTNVAQEAAARAAARAFVVSPNSQLAQYRARSVVATVMRDAGISRTQVQTVITCSASPCLTPGEVVSVTVTRDYTASVMGSWINHHMKINAAHSVMVNGLSS